MAIKQHEMDFLSSFGGFYTQSLPHDDKNLYILFRAMSRIIASHELSDFEHNLYNVVTYPKKKKKASDEQILAKNLEKAVKQYVAAEKGFSYYSKKYYAWYNSMKDKYEENYAIWREDEYKQIEYIHMVMKKILKAKKEAEAKQQKGGKK